MFRAQRRFNWHKLIEESGQRAQPALARPRLRMLLALVAAASVLVLLRAVQLELTVGERFRAEATRPLSRSRPLAADRGAIISRDGQVLACDTHTGALALHYRWLEQPTDPDWLRRQVTAGLTRAQRRDPALVARRQAELVARRDELHRRLSQVCGLSDEDWQARCRRVQADISQLAVRVNERRLRRHLSALEQAEADREADSAAGAPWWQAATSALADLFAPEAPRPPARLILAEELDHHPLVEDLPAEVAEEITGHPDDYPGVRIVQLAHRTYPAGELAAHVVGHLGPPTPEEIAAGHLPATPVGRLGLELQFESQLRGTPGSETEQLDHRGRPSGGQRRRLPAAGQAVRLTIDARVQRCAEELLDQACRPRNSPGGNSSPASADNSAAGGAIVLMNVHDGQLLALASAPRFDPQAFVAGDPSLLAKFLSGPNHPLVDRPARMALPPGSVFKTLSAIALLESEVCTPQDEFYCEGFLHDPDRQRCLIFRQQGVGHGAICMADALAQSCNVYFFHHASQLGPELLVHWARRFGFGSSTGIELPGEVAGNLPHVSPDQPQAKRMSVAQALSIGQGSLTVTPLQIARLMAAVANGGRLVQPRLRLDHAGGSSPHDSVADWNATGTAALQGEPIRVSSDTLRAVREGLRRTVADPRGTAHNAARLAGLPIAGKTGTAQTAGADHAWFAGFAPAEEPCVAIVVVLEHGGSAAQAARMTRDVAALLRKLGYIAHNARELAAE